MTTAWEKPLCMWVPNEWVRESKNPSVYCQEPLRPSATSQAYGMESARKCLRVVTSRKRGLESSLEV